MIQPETRDFDPEVVKHLHPCASQLSQPMDWVPFQTLGTSSLSRGHCVLMAAVAACTVGWGTQAGLGASRVLGNGGEEVGTKWGTDMFLSSGAAPSDPPHGLGCHP